MYFKYICSILQKKTLNMDKKDVNSEFLHNVQTAVDNTGVGGRVGVINTEQGPITVIFMDENEGSANTVTSDGDTTIQYVVDNSDTSTMQYISEPEGTATTVQYVTDDTTANASNVQYFRDESGQLIQYVNDTSMDVHPSNISGTVTNGATEVATYLVDEVGNIIQYISSNASAGINETSLFGIDPQTMTYTGNTNLAVETTAKTVFPKMTVATHTPSSKLDSVVEVEPVIKLIPTTVPAAAKQADPQMATLIKQPSSGQANSVTYKLQHQNYPTQKQKAPSIITIQPNVASVKHTSVMPKTQLPSKQPISLLTNKQTKLVGQPSSKPISAKTTKSSGQQANVITISPSTVNSRPAVKESLSAAKHLPKSRVVGTKSDFPKIHLVKSPSKPKAAVLESRLGVIETMQQLSTPSTQESSIVHVATTSTYTDTRHVQSMSSVLNVKPLLNYEITTQSTSNILTNQVPQTSNVVYNTVNLNTMASATESQTANVLSSFGHLVSAGTSDEADSEIAVVGQTAVQTQTCEPALKIPTITVIDNSQVNLNVVNGPSNVTVIKPDNKQNVISTESNVTANQPHSSVHSPLAIKPLSGLTSPGKDVKAPDFNSNNSFESNDSGKFISLPYVEKNEKDLSNGNIINNAENSEIYEQIESNLNEKHKVHIMEQLDTPSDKETDKEHEEGNDKVDSSETEDVIEVELNNQGLPMKGTYGKYKCDKCHFRFVNKSSLDRHMLIHLQDPTYRCDICYKKLFSAHSVKRHKLVVHAAPKVQCPQCQKQFQLEKNCLRHMQQSGHKGAVVMLNEDEELLSSDDLESASDEEAPSDIMKSIFGIRKGIDKSNRYRKDKICPPGITYKYNYDTGTDKGYKCSICKRYFSTKKSRLLHKKRVHEELKCRFCEKSYNNYYLLRAHTRNVHTGPFTCKVCKSSFEKRDSYTEHMKSHLSDRWKCNLCDKGFCKLKELKRHKSSVHKDPRSKKVSVKKYKPPSKHETCLCEQCGKSFTNTMNYRKHLIWTHGGYRPHTCKECGAGFGKKQGLDRHIPLCGTKEETTRIERLKMLAEARVTGEAKQIGTHLCDSCGRSFRTALGLKAHKHLAHSNILKKGKSYFNVHSNYEVLTWNDLTIEEKQSIKFSDTDNLIENKTDAGNGVSVDQSTTVTNETINQTCCNEATFCSNKKQMSVETQRNSVDEYVPEYLGSDIPDKGGNVAFDENLENVYRCKICQLCFKIKEIVIRHIRLHRTICGPCNKKFQCYNSLRKHNLIHHSDDKQGQYACPQCPKSYHVLSHLRTHYKCHKGPWKCEIAGCDKVFQEKTNLDQHRLTHVFKCLCGKHFRRKDNFLFHFAMNRCRPTGALEAINSDHGYVDSSRQEAVPPPASNASAVNFEIPDNMPFTADELAAVGEPVPCPECKKQFTQRHKMEYHRIRVHSGKSNRLNKCELCDFRAATACELAKHTEIHNRTFKCNLCTKSYYTDERLQKHVATHYKDKYQCFYCQKMYLRESSCKKHILLAHSLQQSNTKDIPRTSDVSNVLPELPEDIFQPSSLEESETSTIQQPNIDDGDLVAKSLPSHIPEQEMLPAVISQPIANLDIPILPSTVTALKCDPESTDEPDEALLMNQVHNAETEMGQSGEQGPQDPSSREMNPLPRDQPDNMLEPEDPVDDADTIGPEGLEGFAPIREIPFKCRQCEQEYLTEKQLRNHIMSSYIDNYFCNICNEDLKSKYRLQRHVLEVHSVGKPYKCATCGSAYTNAASYWRHAQIHARLITCNICHKAFNQHGDLRRHVFKMHGIGDPHICAFCGATFQDRQLYKQHRVEVHGVASRNYQLKNRQCKQSSPTAEGLLKTENKQSNSTTEAKVSVEDDPSAETVEAAKLMMDTANLAARNQSLPEAQGTVVLAQQSQPILLPAGMGDKGEVTIQLYSDGTMMTTDGTNVDYGSVDLSSLGINPDMLKDNTNIELIIVEGDGDQIKQALETDPNKLTNVLANNPSQTVTVKKTPVKFKKGKFKGPKIAKYNKYINTNSKSSQKFHCRYCPRKFNYFRHLRCHEIAHTSKKNIVCPLCQRSFIREANLASHLELHKKKTILPVQPPKFRRHRRTSQEIANDKGNHECETCHKTFHVKSRLIRHINEVHLNKSMQPCPICGVKLKSENSVQRHLKIHIGPFNCYECGTQFTSRDEYLDHQKKIHPLRHYACRICKKQFTTKNFLFTHLRKVHASDGDKTLLAEDLKPYECKECGKFFGRRGTLNKHMIVHTDIRKFPCNICGHRFAYNWKLQQHIKNVHLNEKNHQCSDCGATFKGSKSVTLHKSTWHSGPYTCNACSISFDHKQELHDHQFIVHDMNRNACGVCKITFKNNNELNRHHSKVHVKCAHLCDLCGEGFPHKTKLKAHLIKEHFDGEEEKLIISYPNMKNVMTSETTSNSGQRYSCDFCDKSFPYKIPFKAHLKSIHFDGDETALYEKYPFLLRVSDPADPVVCDYCGKTFSRMQTLNQHLIVHGVVVQKKHIKEEIIPSDEEPDLKNIEPREKTLEYSCDVCGRKFSRSASLKKHVATHEEMNEIDVVMRQLEQEENERAEEEEQLEREGTLTIKGATKEYNCPVCKKIFKRKVDLDSHYMSEHETGKERKHNAGIDGDKFKSTSGSDLECDSCGKTFSKNINLRRHSALKHGIKLESSQDTDDQPITEVKRKKLSSNSARKTYVCKVCEEIFQKMKQFDKHMATEHQDMDKEKAIKTSSTCKTSRKCRKCEKSFSKMKNLKRHMLKCKANNAASDDTSASKDEVSSEDKSSTISQFLGMNFSLELKRETAPFDIEAVKSKTHKCKQCGEAFSREATLKKHLTLHKDSSDEEDASDTEYDVLDVSKLIFPCKVCGHMYASTWGIIQHTRDKHSNVDEEVVKAQIDEILSEKEKKGQNVEFYKTSGTNSKSKPEAAKSPMSGIPVVKVSKEQTYSCTYCGNIYASAMGRAKHIQIMHPGRKINCGAPVTTPSPSSLSLSVPRPKETTVSTSGRIITKKVIEDAAFQCAICEKIFMDDINLRRHMTMKHGIKHAISKPDLKSEPPKKKVKLTDEKECDEYSCSKCFKSFVALINLKRHMAMKHKTKISYQSLLAQKDLKDGQSKKSTPTLHSTVSDDDQNNVYECNICYKLYTDFSNLRRHMKMKHDVENTGDLLKTHPELVRRMTIHTCKICLKRFPKLYALKCHMRMKHNQKYEDTEKGDSLGDMQVRPDEDVKIEANVLKCSVCHSDFASKKTLAVHMRKHTGETPFKCSLCDEMFMSKFKLECHYNSQHIDKYSTMVKCKTCLHLFMTSEELKKHQIEHTKSKELECRFCKLRFIEKKKYEEHMKVHTDRPYKCEQCVKAFRWRRNLTAHVNLFHNTTESLTCSVCFKTFTSKEKINRHMVIHKVKRFSCMKCGKTFGKETLLQSHMKAAHKGKSKVAQLARKSPVKEVDKPLMTCNICNKGYHTQEKLLQHMLLHTSVKQSRSVETTANNTCPECGKTFDRKWKVSKHLASVHKKRNTATSSQQFVNKESPPRTSQNYCRICKITFTQSCNYRRHMKNTHEPPDVSKSSSIANIAKEHVCPVCNNSFSRNWNLKKHVQTIHKCNLEDLPTDNIVPAAGSNMNLSCFYCSDCNKVHWSVNSYTAHLKEMHPDRPISELDEQIQAQLLKTEIKTEVIEPDSLPVEDQSPKKRPPAFGPVRLKCEFCGRVHWTETSFNAHMLKYHTDQELGNPVIELVNDGEHDHFEAAGSMQSSPIIDKQLCDTPVVRLERISQPVKKGTSTVETSADHDVNQEGNANLEGVTGDLQTDVVMDSDLQDIGNNSIVMQDNDDTELGTCTYNITVDSAHAHISKLQIDIDPSSQNTDTIGIFVDKENLDNDHDVDSPQLVPASPVDMNTTGDMFLKQTVSNIEPIGNSSEMGSEIVPNTPKGICNEFLNEVSISCLVGNNSEPNQEEHSELISDTQVVGGHEDPILIGKPASAHDASFHMQCSTSEQNSNKDEMDCDDPVLVEQVSITCAHEHDEGDGNEVEMDSQGSVFVEPASNTNDGSLQVTFDPTEDYINKEMDNEGPTLVGQASSDSASIFQVTTGHTTDTSDKGQIDGECAVSVCQESGSGDKSLPVTINPTGDDIEEEAIDSDGPLLVAQASSDGDASFHVTLNDTGDCSDTEAMDNENPVLVGKVSSLGEFHDAVPVGHAGDTSGKEDLDTSDIMEIDVNLNGHSSS